MKNKALIVIVGLVAFYFIFLGEKQVFERYTGRNGPQEVTDTQNVNEDQELSEYISEVTDNLQTTESTQSTSSLNLNSTNAQLLKLSTILSDKNNMVCTIQSEPNSQAASIGVYVSEGNYKIVQRTPQSNGQSYEEIILKNSEGIFIWNGNENQGILISNEFASSQNGRNMVEDLIAQMNQLTEYVCVAWAPTVSTFSTPTEIQFIDAAVLTGENADPEALCTFCNQAPDEQSKQECLRELNCK